MARVSNLVGVESGSEEDQLTGSTAQLIEVSNLVGVESGSEELPVFRSSQPDVQVSNLVGVESGSEENWTMTGVSPYQTFQTLLVWRVVRRGDRWPLVRSLL